MHFDCKKKGIVSCCTVEIYLEARMQTNLTKRRLQSTFARLLAVASCILND